MITEETADFLDGCERERRKAHDIVADPIGSKTLRHDAYFVLGHYAMHVIPQLVAMVKAYRKAMAIGRHRDDCTSQFSSMIGDQCACGLNDIAEELQRIIEEGIDGN